MSPQHSPAMPLGARPVPGQPGGPPTAYLPPAAPRQTGVGTVVALVVLGVLVLVAVGVIGATVGVAALPAATVLALLPLALVLLAIRWVDRWEPEPLPALAVAFGWGASVSVLVALVLNTGAMLVLVSQGAAEDVATVLGAVVVAPVVEESVKALGVLLVFLVWRRWFDGPVDGVVYGATVAAGFAFVENILYFGQTITVDGGDGTAVATVFVMRAVMSPFAHLLFTACTGLAIGLAARRGGAAWVWATPIGLLLAILLHAYWNGTALMGTLGDFISTYVVLQVPLFLAAVGLVLWLRRREAAVIRDRIREYAAAGWFAPVEVPMLSTLAGRRHARSWARRAGGPRAQKAMGELQRVATRLAFQRQRVLAQRGDLRARYDEAVLLGALTRARQELHVSLGARG